MHIVIVFTALLGIAEGILISRLREYFFRARLRRWHERSGKPDETVVCENAMVVWDGKNIAWYDKDKCRRCR